MHSQSVFNMTTEQVFSYLEIIESISKIDYVCVYVSLAVFTRKPVSSQYTTAVVCPSSAIDLRVQLEHSHM